MKSWSLLPILLLCALGMLSPGSARAAESEVVGAAVAGLRLGLSLTPAHTSLPAELVVKVWLHNQSPSVKLVPLSLCNSIRWPAYGKLNVRVDGGRTYHLRMAAMIDTADVHDHAPLVLQPGERQEQLISLSEAAQFLPADDSDMGLAEQLLSAQQIEISAEFGGGAKDVPRLAAGPIHRRLALTPLTAPLGPSCVVKLSAANNQSCVLNRLGSPYCWGAQTIGWNPQTKRNVESHPKLVRRLQRGVRSLGFGATGPCALTTDGVLCLSGGGESQNGQWTTLRIGGLPGELTRLWTGSAAQCAQSPSGELWCWDLTGNAAQQAKQVTQLGTETQEVVIGRQHVCAQTRRGAVLCWGDNTVGQLGRGDQSPHGTPTEIVELGAMVRKLVAGTNYTCALLSAGTVSCWGKSEYGAFGSTAMLTKPTPLPALGTSVIGLYAAHDQLCAQSQDGSVSCLGGVFLDREHATTKTPMKIVGLPTELAELTIGPTDACAVTRSGELWCWGELLRRNYTGTKLLTISGAQRMAGLQDVATVAIDAYAACALTRAGSVYCWGDGGNGQLGAGSLTHSVTPVRVAIPCSQ